MTQQSNNTPISYYGVDIIVGDTPTIPAELEEASLRADIIATKIRARRAAEAE